MPDKPISEKEWQKRVKAWAKARGWMIQRTDYSPYSTPGWPDLVLCRPESKEILFVELKSNKGALRPEQEVWLRALEACDLEVYVWHPYDEKQVLAMLT